MYHKIFYIAAIATAIFYSEVVQCRTPSVDDSSKIVNDISSVQFHTSFQSNNKLDFKDFLSGVNSVYVITSDKIPPMILDDSLFLSKYRKLLTTYLQGIGMQNVAISLDEQEQLDRSVSLTTAAIFQIHFDYAENYISKIILSFTSCNKDEFQFAKNIDYYIGSNWDESLLGFFKDMYWQTVLFDPNKSYKLLSVITSWNEKEMTEYFSNNPADKIEGIYEKFGAEDQYRIGIIKNKSNYDIIYLSGAKNKLDWNEGELKGNIRQTAIKDFYKVDWVLADKSKSAEVYLSTAEEHFLKIDFLDPKIGASSKYIKMYPPFSQGKSVKPSGFASSGTGFAISKDGLIATSYHVVEGANEISIKFSTDKNNIGYDARVLFSDKINDLAVLGIDDSGFAAFDEIPYSINPAEAELGTDVFTLGYPLIETMGKSVKLNIGLVSSNSGFLDDNKYYQLTMPINSGNSGGPLFDKSGNLLGIITGKHSGAESVAYAMKSFYLSDLVKNIPQSQVMIHSQSSGTKTLTEVIQSVQKYICLIEVK
ncbi:MAG: serine protease [bacterium]